MFRSARWKTDKPKIKVVFKLQFQVTQVPQSGWDSLMLSLINVDIGRPTVRLDKVSVRDGACRWERPICETIKFAQETKTGKFNEKIYKVIVSSGLSKSVILGEAAIDFSEYTEAIRPTSVSFSLKNLNSTAVLHVLIQRLHGDVYQSGVEENGHLTAESQDESSQISVRSENGDANGNLVTPRGDDAISTSGSENSSERNTPREFGPTSLTNSNINHQGPTSFLSTLSRSPMAHKRSSTEWSVSSAPGGSTDDSTNSSEDNLTKERFVQPSDLSVEKLKSDIVNLARQAEVSELELQTLRKQIVKENKRGQDLSREVVSLREERNALRKENEQLKSSQKHTKVSSKFEFGSEDSASLVEELRQELNHEKDLNKNLRLQLQKTQESNSELILAVQDLEEMLGKKNRGISELSKRSARNEVDVIVPNHETSEDDEQKALEMIIKEHDDARDVYMLEQKMIDLYNEIDVYQRDRDEHEMQMEQLALDYEILKQENHDLYSKLEKNRVRAEPKTELELQIQIKNMENQMKNREEQCSVSLATISELEAQVESLGRELKNRDEEFSNSLITISEIKTQVEILSKELKNQEDKLSVSLVTKNDLENQVKSLGREMKSQEDEYLTSLATISELEDLAKSLEKELEKQVQEFVSDLEDLTRAKVEQEKRAILAEEALKKTKWANANTADRLQTEIERLSTEMVFIFDANEKLTKEAVEEANETRLQKIHLEDLLEKANKEIGLVKNQYEGKFKDLFDQIETRKVQEKMVGHDNGSMNLQFNKEHEEKLEEACGNELENENFQTQAFCRSDLLMKEVLLLEEAKSLEMQIPQKEDTLKKSTQEILEEEEELGDKVEQLEKGMEDHNQENNTSDIEIKWLKRENEDKNLNEVLHEMQILKKRNNSMEGELKDMQGRYSELSLKFAEVEGERQQLVMAVRNLKISQKI